MIIETAFLSFPLSYDKLISMNQSSKIQFLTYIALMATGIFIPLFAKDLGASALLIGLIVAAYNSIYFFSSSIFGMLTDKFEEHFFIRLGLLLCSIVFGMHIFVHDLFSLFTVRILAGLCVGIYPAALAVYAFEEREGKMGKFTAYGSLGWSVGCILAGITGNYYIIFSISGLLFLASFFISLPVQEKIADNKKEKISFPSLLRKNFRVYMPYFLRNIGAQAIWSVFPVYLIELGANKFWIGIIHFLNAFTQFIIMPRIEKYKNIYLIQVGVTSSIIVFLCYGLSNSWFYLLPIQFLLAFAFSALQVGSIQELLNKNVEKSSVMGILNSTSNFAAAIGPFLAGIIAEFFGFKGVMYFGALTSVFALFVFSRLKVKN
jgi:MFS family permease